MSFASDTKKEICHWEPTRDCCRKAEAYGLWLFARGFSLQKCSFVTENGPVARRMAQRAAEVAGVVVEVQVSMHRQGEGSYTLGVPGEDQRRQLLEAFGHTGQELHLRINRANLENECCLGAFVRGAFLSCGTVTNPQKDYHLEFTVNRFRLAQDLVTLLEEIEGLRIQPSLTRRKGSCVVYLKDSEQIADLLTYMGAQNAAMELMQAKMVKEVRNYVNRTTNFETANIDKTASAAARQIAAIHALEKNPGLEKLPEDLREVARLRLENPEMSLREMGETLGISRSGVNHRLKRLLEMSSQTAPGSSSR